MFFNFSSIAIAVSVFTNLHEDSRSQVLISIPPVAGTAGATTGTEDALVQAILLE